MLYIPCIEFQFCVHYIQLPLEKKKASKRNVRLPGKKNHLRKLFPTVAMAFFRSMYLSGKISCTLRPNMESIHLSHSGSRVA